MYSNSRNQTSSNSNRVNQRNIMEMFSSAVRSSALIEARRKEKEEKRNKIEKKEKDIDKILNNNIKKYEKIQSSYGFYVKEIGSVDWASNEIRNKDKQRF